MLIYIVRHGETRANVEGYYQGWSDDPLTENGRRLAEITGRGLRNVRFDECWSSPLGRSMETAEIILRESGNDIPVKTDDRLKEIDMGDWDGKHFHPDEIEVDPELAMMMLRDPLRFGACPGGESFVDLTERCGAFLRELIARDDGRTYLVATHGVALRGMLNFLYDDPEDFWHGHVPYNCAVNIVEAEKGKARLVADDKVYYGEEDVVDRFAVD